MKQFHIKQSLLADDVSISAKFTAYAMSEFSHNQNYMPCFSLEAFSQWLRGQGCSEKRLNTILLGWNELLDNGYIVKLHKYHGECCELDLFKLNSTSDDYFYLENYETTAKILKLKAQNWLDLFSMYLAMISSMYNPSKCNPATRGRICYMTQEYFAKKFNTTTRTIARWIDLLIEADILFKKNSNMKYNGHRFNLYSRSKDKELCAYLASLKTGNIMDNIANYKSDNQTPALI